MSRRKKRPRSLVEPLPRVTLDVESDTLEQQHEKLTEIGDSMSRLHSLRHHLEQIERLAASGDPSEIPALNELRCELRRYHAWAEGKPPIDEFRWCRGAAHRHQPRAMRL